MLLTIIKKGEKCCFATFSPFKEIDHLNFKNNDQQNNRSKL